MRGLRVYKKGSFSSAVDKHMNKVKKASDIEVVKKMLLLGIQNFLTEDIQLLELNVREEALSHRLAYYLERALETHKYDLSVPRELLDEIRIDCEYDKHGNEKKNLSDIMQKYPDNNTDVVRPDIVMHVRGSDTHNLMVIEVKKTNGKDKTYAKEKVASFVTSSYAYMTGVYMEFNTGDSLVEGVCPLFEISTYQRCGALTPNTDLRNYICAQVKEMGEMGTVNCPPET